MADAGPAGIWLTLAIFPLLIRKPLPLLVTVQTAPPGRSKSPTGMHENGPTCAIGCWMKMFP